MEVIGRTRQLVRNVMLSFGIKGLSLIVSIATMPVYILYFGNNELLGLWFTILSVLSWILNCDMGIGNGLRNRLTEALAKNDYDGARVQISSSYAFLAILSVVVLVVLGGFSRVIPWNSVFNIDAAEISQADLLLAVRIILASIVLQLALRLISSVLFALQKAFVPGLLNLISNFLLLAYSYYGYQIGLDSGVVQMATVYLFAVNLPLAVATVLVFVFLCPSIAPKLNLAKMHCFVDILKLGSAFLWLQLMALLLNNTSSFLIALLIGNQAVVEYQIYFKIFTLASTLVMLVATPIWSAATKAQAENEFGWLWRLYCISMLMLAVVVVANCLLCFVLQPIFDIWLGFDTQKASLPIALHFALYGSLVAISNIITTFANGLGELKIQTIFLTLGALLNVPVAIVLGTWSGSYVGILDANIMAYIPYVVFQGVWLCRYLNRKSKSFPTC